MDDIFSLLDNTPQNNSKVCSHEDVESGICVVCFAHVQQFSGISFSESKHYVPRRMPGNQIRPDDVNNIYIPPQVSDFAREIFETVAQGIIFRGRGRKAVICACLIHGFIKFNHPYSHEEIMSKFGISKKECLQGLKKVDTRLFHNNREKYNEICNSNITFDSELKKICKKHNLVFEELEKYKHRIISSARAPTAAAAVLWLWNLEHKKFSHHEIIEETELSAATIKKVVQTK